jgi:hypothetical protein
VTSKLFGLVSTLLLLSSCKGGPMPQIDVSIYTGWPEDGAIVRTQANEKIACTEPAFAEFRCLRGGDLKKIYEAFFLCEKWKNGVPMMSDTDMLRYLMLVEGWK